jgi:hypothetical protein
MTRGKTLVFATDEEGTPALRRNLHAWRKRTPGVTYSSADLAGWTFAFHGVYAGSAPSWMYGFGTTDAAGVLTLTEVHDSAGGSGSPGVVATLAIDATGVVVNVGGMLRGVMTPDKHAILCVDVAGAAADPLPGFLVVQRTGETFGLPDLAGERVAHGIISGADATSSGWFHGVNAFDSGGLQTFSAYASSTGATALPAPRQYALSPGGVLTTTADPTFHGQLAHDATYSVRTGTTAAGPILVVNAR